MLVASSGKVLILGLERENIDRLVNDQPIRKEVGDIPGLEGWTVYILGPEDTARLVAQHEAAGGGGEPASS